MGIRIPDNRISRALVHELGNPIISASIKDEDQIIQYTTDAEIIFERYKEQVDVVVDGGLGGVEPSTVADLTSGSVDIIREGLGELSLLY